MTSMSAPAAPAVFAGAATLDAIALVSRFPQPDERQVAEDVTYAGGGPAATAAVAAVRLGVPAAFVGTVGDDPEGSRILDGQRAEGVDISGAQVEPGERSGVSVVVADRARGTRAICARPSPDVRISRESPAADLIRAAPWVHADHVGWAAVDAFRQAERTPPAPLSVDAGNPIPGFRPAGVDLLVPTMDALARMYGERGPGDLLDAALADGARCVVATRGADSTLAATGAGERYEIPAYPVEVHSTLGAGDVFHGALLASLVRGFLLPTALRYASVAAALSCRGLDGRSAIPEDAEVRRRCAEISPSTDPEQEIV